MILTVRLYHKNNHYSYLAIPGIDAYFDHPQPGTMIRGFEELAGSYKPNVVSKICALCLTQCGPWKIGSFGKIVISRINKGFPVAYSDADTPVGEVDIDTEILCEVLKSQIEEDLIAHPLKMSTSYFPRRYTRLIRLYAIYKALYEI